MGIVVQPDSGTYICLQSLQKSEVAGKTYGGPPIEIQTARPSPEWWDVREQARVLPAVGHLTLSQDLKMTLAGHVKVACSLKSLGPLQTQIRNRIEKRITHGPCLVVFVLRCFGSLDQLLIMERELEG